MHNVIAWAGRLVFGAAIVLALGFGGQQAFGSSSAVDCPYCDTYEDCYECCGDLGGDCINNFVCVCL